MFWLFWQLVGVVLGLLAIFVIVLLFTGAAVGIRQAVLRIRRHPAVIPGTLIIVLILFVADSYGGWRATIFVSVLAAAVVASASQHLKDGTTPFRCKCGAWVHLRKCPKLNNEAINAKVEHGLAQLERGEGVSGDQLRKRLEADKAAWLADRSGP